MKIRNKFLLASIIPWAAFFLILAIIPMAQHNLIFTSTIVIACMMLDIYLHMVLLRNLFNETSKEINKIEENGVQKNNYDIDEDILFDEIDNLRKKVTDLQNNIDFQIGEKTKFLTNKNSWLQKEIADLKASQNKTDTTAKQSGTLLKLLEKDLFIEISNKSLNHARRNKLHLAILLIKFKNIEEIHAKIGSKNYDELIKKIGERFQSTLRSEDIIAKFDSNTFSILLTDIKKYKFASTVSEKLINSLQNPFNINDSNIFVDAYIGISVFPDDGESIACILENAEAALNINENGSDSAYHFYNTEINSEAMEYTRMCKDLRIAIANNDLELHYQPKINIKTGNISGLEALIRWKHPEYGIVNPVKLIEFAEESGQIITLGDWVIKQSCIANKYLQDAGYERVPISVNISYKQFYYPKLVDSIISFINEIGINSFFLQLEIDEKTIMDNIDQAKQILDKLKSIGLLLSIDHFGTGYTSISYLKKLPLTEVKIDREYIRGVPMNPDDVAITNALISLLKSLGISVVAEGVETAEQVQHLVDQHCDIVQGYFLSQPLPIDKIKTQLKKLNSEVML